MTNGKKTRKKKIKTIPFVFNGLFSVVSFSSQEHSSVVFNRFVLVIIQYNTSSVGNYFLQVDMHTFYCQALSILSSLVILMEDFFLKILKANFSITLRFAIISQNRVCQLFIFKAELLLLRRALLWPVHM